MVRPTDVSAPPVLKSGDRGEWVMQLQAFLADLGFYPGKPDGVFGPDTERAVMEFQSKHELEPDGVVGPVTWRVLQSVGFPMQNESGAEPTGPVLKGNLEPEVAIQDSPIQQHAPTQTVPAEDEAKVIADLEERASEAKASKQYVPYFEAQLALADFFAERRPSKSVPQAMKAYRALKHIEDPIIRSDKWLDLLRFFSRLNKWKTAAKFMDEAETVFRSLPRNNAEHKNRLLEFLTLKQQAFSALGMEDIERQVAAEIEALKRITPTTGVSPPPKIVSDLWTREDHLGYGPYARALATLITHPETRPPLTIGLKAQWGAGKTSLMRMVQYLLDGDMHKTDLTAAETPPNNSGQHWPTAKLTYQSLLDFLRQPRRETYEIQRADNPGARYGIGARPTVWFNAWKYQSSEQIWAGLAHAIITQVTSRMNPLDREKFWLQMHYRRINPHEVRRKIYRVLFDELLPTVVLCASIGVLLLVLALLVSTPFKPLIGGFSSLSFGAAIVKGLLQRKQQLRKTLEGSFQSLVREPDYEGRMGFLHLVESDIREVLNLVATPEQPLVIFIDDLDRCAPRHVAEVVEAINLFLAGDFPNCIFVIGMEPEIVAAALEVANKDLIATFRQFHISDDRTPMGWRFMEKIIQLPLTLPPPTAAGLRRYVQYLAEEARRREEEEASEGAAQAHPETEAIPDEQIAHYEQQLAEAKDLRELQELSESWLRQETDTVKKHAVAEASKRQFARKLRESDPVVHQFVEKAAFAFQANPRKLKRYINLFRFLCTLRHDYRVDHLAEFGTEPDLPSDEVITRFVMLCVQWPQALGLLGTGGNGGEARKEAKSGLSLLAQFEKQAQTLIKSRKRMDTRLEEWEEFVRASGLTPIGWVMEDAFLTFLGNSKTLLSSYEGCGLW